MKKKFTFMMAAVMLLMMVLPWRAVGQTDVINDAVTSSYLDNTATNQWVTFSINGSSSEAGYTIRSMGTKDQTEALRWNANAYMYMTSSWSGKRLKSITITTTSNTKNISLYAQTSAYSAAPTGTALATINASTSGGTYTFAENTNYTYLALKGTTGSTYIASISIVWETPASVAKPQFNPEGGAYGTSIDVEISCETTGAEIYYTDDGVTTPTSSSTPYTGAIQLSSAKTIKAIAIKGNESSSVATAAYTFISPLTSIDAVISDATTNTSSHQVAITFDNWVVTGTTGQNVYLNKGTKGAVITQAEHGFEPGNVLSGTATCNLSLSQYGYAQITNLKSNNYGLTVTTGGTVNAFEATLDDLDGSNVGAVVTLKNMTYTQSSPYYFLYDGDNYVWHTTSITPFPQPAYSWTIGKSYDVTGIFWINYQVNNMTDKRINPRSADDIEEVLPTTPTLYVNPSSLTGFTYGEGYGPSTAKTITVSGINLNANAELTFQAGDNTDYEMSLTEDGTYAKTLSLTPSESTLGETTVYVRLKAGLTIEGGVYEDELRINSTGATQVTVDLSGFVTEPCYEYSFAGANNFLTTYPGSTHPSSGSGNNVETIYYATNGHQFTASGGSSRYFSSTNSGYFLLGATNAKISLPSYANCKITKVVLHSSGGHSTNVQVSIVAQNGNSEVIASAAQKWATTNTDYTYNIGADYQRLPLSVKVTNSYNTQFTKITVYFEELPKYELEVEAEHGSVEVSVGDEVQTGDNGSYQIYEGSVVSLTAKADDYYHFVEWQAEAEEGTVTIENNQFTMPACYVLVQAVFAEDVNHTVTYSSNGVTADPVVTSETSITLAAGEDINANFTFEGWTKDPNDVENILEAGSSYVFVGNEDVNFYAVYAHTTTTIGGGSSKDDNSRYEKVTSDDDLEDGDYLIVYEGKDANLDPIAYIFNGLSSGGEYVTAEFDNNTISEVPTNAAVVAITSITGGYSIQIADGSTNNGGKYIGGTSGSNTMNFGDEAILNTISISENNAIIISNSTYLRWNLQNSLFRYYKTDSQTSIQLYKYISGSTPAAVTKYYTRVFTSNPGANVELVGPSIIPSDVTLNMGSYTLSYKSGVTIANLIIEDGGQLICSNSVAATVKRTTKEWNENDQTAKGWYAISSPVNNVAIADFAKGTHNVYSYDEPTHYWHEYNSSLGEIAAFDHLANGRGYLYRSTEANIEFAGDVNIANATYTLSYTDAAGNLAGFHLIGNPYTHNIYKGANAAINSEYLTEGFYTLNVNGGWEAGTDNSTAIVPGQAILVQATATVGTGVDLTITKKTTGGPVRYENDRIMFTVKNAEYSDIAYVLFKEGHGLNKIDHRNAEIPMLYVISEGENYAIADMPDNTDVINLGFEAKTMGQYTISLKAEGQYSYMHLVDKLTGNDIDMLVEDSYTFVGTPNDRNDRFVLRLNYNAAGIDTESDIFAYQSGNDIMVSGEGELQVFDITGRKVMTTDINGVETINGMNRGVYIFRLNEKTQKIVVR